MGQTFIIEPGYGFIDWNIREVAIVGPGHGPDVPMVKVARTGRVEPVLKVGLLDRRQAWVEVHNHGTIGQRVRVHYLDGTSKDLYLKPVKPSAPTAADYIEPDDVRAEREDAMIGCVVDVPDIYPNPVA